MKFLNGVTLPIPDDAGKLVGGLVTVDGETYAMLVCDMDHVSSMLAVIEVAVEEMDKENATAELRTADALATWEQLRVKLNTVHRALVKITRGYEINGADAHATLDMVADLSHFSRAPRTRRKDIN